ncbi:UNVERIFIED_CONTAM: Transposon Ty3-G Gag-Pol polyprotein [Sesamum angustifolium]|uniref:Transposon Ty3-G Gag-Pol polyprotein n=1 Tax=Sesamum angustifolium TaxID=2727405 RepID=A0AAW2LUS5_9LAMI
MRSNAPHISGFIPKASNKDDKVSGCKCPLRIQRHIRKAKPKLVSSDSINVPSEAKIPNPGSTNGEKQRREPQANKKRKVDEERIEPTEEVKAIELTLEHVPKITKIGTILDLQLEKILIAFLQENINVFAWDAADMCGIDPKIMVHRLNVNPKIRPVKQKKRAFGNERIKAIKEEVEKLLRIDYIRPVQYPEWLANVVLVPKPNGTWRMCIDFTDLNKAYPKDSFPLPCIDALIDSTSGCELMSFLDAFQGYNQIRLAHDDQEKTSFVTDQGIFCYNVMPFGLKNAGATYQRLINNMFREQIGRNMEVYIDDMMVKSHKKENHKQDLQECFGILQHFGMKLNPTKCTFGVHGGKFLGFMISQRGIEANPEKIKAILEMKPPRTIQEVQRLTGRLAALNRFILRSSDRGLLFFKQDSARSRRKIPSYRKTSIRPSGNSKKTAAIFSVTSNSGPNKPPFEEDGSSTLQGSGADVILETPQGDKIQYALKFSFDASNNEAEYEALLAGGRLAQAAGAKYLRAYSDSQLVVNQVNGDYEAKGEKMIQYLNLIRTLCQKFERFELQRVPRSNNEEADQ